MMKRLVAFLLLLAFNHAVELFEAENIRQCNFNRPSKPRPHSVSILEFGAVGDGKTLNTVAFENAIFYLKSFADKGGAQLYVPSGKWLTGSFNLTSHLTLFLEREAIILGSQDSSHYKVGDPLPSYGRGIDHTGGRYRSLITGSNLTDVVITGDNGTIDGQGSIWWEKFSSHSLSYSRPHIVELISSKNVTVSNITFLNSPAWNIHPIYCSNVLIQNITALSPPESPYTGGIVPDSCDNVCIENSNISMGHDAIALKSGWDEYGITYGKPTTNVHIWNVHLKSYAGSTLVFGNEMSGGISNIIVEHIKLQDSLTGFELKTSKGRGGYIKDVLISDCEFENVLTAIKAIGDCGSHPDVKYDPRELPVITHITFKDMTGTEINTAGNFTGILESPITLICLSNISFSGDSQLHHSPSWVCSNVSGSSENVTPEPCLELQSLSPSSSDCFSPHQKSCTASL